MNFSEIFGSPEMQNRIVAVLLTGLLTLIGRWLKPTPKLGWGISHGFAFNTKDGEGRPVMIRTGTVFVQNIGRAPSENIEVHLNYPPQEFAIWPNLDYTTSTNREGRMIIHVKNLGRREHFQLELIGAGDLNLPDTLRVRSKDGEAKNVTLAPTEVLPVWKVRLIQLVLLLGVFAIIQNALEFIGWLSR